MFETFKYLNYYRNLGNLENIAECLEGTQIENNDRNARNSRNECFCNNGKIISRIIEKRKAPQAKRIQGNWREFQFPIQIWHDFCYSQDLSIDCFSCNLLQALQILKDIKTNQSTKLPNNYHSTHLNLNFQQSFAIREKLFFPIASSIPICLTGNTFT